MMPDTALSCKYLHGRSDEYPCSRWRLVRTYPPAAEPKKRIAPISNVIHVREAMIRCWKEARRGELKVEDASRLVHMLSLIQRSFEISDLEERLRKLEGERE